MLYYNPAAERVVGAVAVPGLSPNVEKVRLTADDEGGAGAQRERDVVQYYQYSADMGNTVGPRAPPPCQAAARHVINLPRSVNPRFLSQRHSMTRRAMSGRRYGTDAATAIGQLLNYGARGMAQDHRLAYRYFTQAAAAGGARLGRHVIETCFEPSFDELNGTS